MDIFDIDGVKAAIYGFFGVIGGGMIKLTSGLVMAQRERDKAVSSLKDDVAAYKLTVSNDYAKKTEIARLHDRIDHMDAKIDTVQATLVEGIRQLTTMVGHR